MSALCDICCGSGGCVEGDRGGRRVVVRGAGGRVRNARGVIGVVGVVEVFM